VFKRAIQFSIKVKQLNMAVDFSKRLTNLYQKLDQRHYVYKQTLTTILLLLEFNDERGAQELLESSHSLPGFMNSDEGKTSDAILQSYLLGDQESLALAAKSSAVKFLDNEVTFKFHVI
jgi:hypothetical protein